MTPLRTMDFLKGSNLFTEIVFFIVHCLILYNLFFFFFLFKTEISYKQKEECLEKEILALKQRVRDLED